MPAQITSQDPYVSFACSCGGDIVFDLTKSDIPSQFSCPICGQAYNQNDWAWINKGNKGTVLIPDNMWHEVSVNTIDASAATSTGDKAQNAENSTTTN